MSVPTASTVRSIGRIVTPATVTGTGLGAWSAPAVFSAFAPHPPAPRRAAASSPGEHPLRSSRHARSLFDSNPVPAGGEPIEQVAHEPAGETRLEVPPRKMWSSVDDMISPRQTWAHDSTRVGSITPPRPACRATSSSDGVERLAEPVDLVAEARPGRPEADRVDEPGAVGVVRHEVELTWKIA